jgi:sulfonate transport system ATP-binding protein
VENLVDFASDHAGADANTNGLALTARELQKSFGPNRILRGVSFHIWAGQFVAVVGRSGCGKSTLLRLLLGLDKPSQGQFWFGKDPQAQPKRDAIRIMFQEPRRPRERGSNEFAALEGRILRDLFRNSPAGEDT